MQHSAKSVRTPDLRCSCRDQACLVGLRRSRCPGPAGGAVDRRLGDRSGPGWGTGPGCALACALVLGWSCLVPGGPGRGWSDGPGVVGPVRCGVSVGAQHVGQRGPHAQDQDRQAGHDGGDGPRCPCRPGLGQQVVGHLPGHAEREGADRRPLREPAGPGADPVLAGQPGAQRVHGVGLDADRQGDRHVDVQRGPDSRQRRDQAEPGPRRDPDPAGPDLSGRRGSQDKQRPGPDRGPRTSSGGPVRTRQADRSPVRRGPAGRLGSQDRCTGSAGLHGLGQGSHDHSQSGVASG